MLTFYSALKFQVDSYSS